MFCSLNSFAYTSIGLWSNLPWPNNLTLAFVHAASGIKKRKVEPDSFALHVIFPSCLKRLVPVTSYVVLSICLILAPKAFMQPTVASISFEFVTLETRLVPSLNEAQINALCAIDLDAGIFTFPCTLLGVTFTFIQNPPEVA